MENSRECRIAALALHKLDGEGDSETSFQMQPLYIYVPSEKLCLYKGGFQSEVFRREYLKNVMTNETIAEYVSVDGRDFKGSESEFKEIQARYFNSADGR